MSWFDEQEAQMPGGAVIPMDGYMPPDSAPQARQRGPVDPAILQNGQQRTWDPRGGDAGGGMAGGYQPYSDQAFRAILQKYPPTNDGVRQAYAEVQRTFGPNVVQLLDHPERLDKFVTPTGTYDTVIGAGGPNPSWGWIREGAHGGGGGTLGGLMGGGMGGAMSPQGVGPLIGSPLAGRNWQDDPGYGFRLTEGLKALEKSAAARGTLLTGGTLKGLARFAQDYASNEFQNAYARAASEQGNNFSRLFNVAGMGLNATNNAQNLISGYNQNIAGAQIGQGNVAAGATQAQGAANANTVGTLGNIAGQWLTDYYGRRSGGSNTGDYLDYGRGLY